MAPGFSSLHRALRDETRKRILIVLKEKSRLSYTELKNAVGVESKGRFNYHLRVLGDLILKGENGEYALTEEGHLALKLLEEFPDAAQGVKPAWWNKFWRGVAVLVVAVTAVSVLAYSLGFIGLPDLEKSIYSILGATGIAYMYQHIYRNVLSRKERLTFNKVLFVIFGTLTLGFALWAVSMVTLQATGVLTVLKVFFGTDFSIALVFVSCYILGPVIGYEIGKYRDWEFPQF
jgi:DNA-binding transcriptional ArsR family regulator